MKGILGKYYARLIRKDILKWSRRPWETQQKELGKLIDGAKNTVFGKEHQFNQIETHDEFKKRVPIRDYEKLRPYIDRVVMGEADVLWKGIPLYLCKTSGTTSGAKYIPLTKESMPNHIHSARNALLCYIAETGNVDFVNGKMIFLQGSPDLNRNKKIPIGRLSGIVAHYVPQYLQKNRMPSMQTNRIEDWEEKVEAIAKETLKEDLRLISGIPSWVQMYYEKLIEISGKKTIKEIFPNFSLFVYGGVAFEPYRERFEALIGKEIPSIELYPASEGFIAFQDSQKEEGLLLVLNKGIFYEFIPVEEIDQENPTRLNVSEVNIGVNYAIVLNTNAGLWGYIIGDTVKFVSLNPARIIVTGRIKHYTSAFGEHVIAEEVERALKIGMQKENAKVIEFTVAPEVNPIEGLPYHEWLIEFDEEPESMERLEKAIDDELQLANIYYKDLIEGNVLRPLKIVRVRKEGFINYMKTQGKLGGQNKVPRLSNNRKIANRLSKLDEQRS